MTHEQLKWRGIGKILQSWNSFWQIQKKKKQLWRQQQTNNFKPWQTFHTLVASSLVANSKSLLDHTFQRGVCARILLLFFIFLKKKRKKCFISLGPPCRAVARCSAVVPHEKRALMMPLLLGSRTDADALFCFPECSAPLSQLCCVSVAAWAVAGYSSMKRYSSSSQLPSRCALLPHAC